jgi:MOSC domain-containing protein YiiM
MPTLVAACIVRDLRKDAGYFGVTAIDKAPATGAVKVTSYGLRGDVQADRKHHGGLDKALYAYASEDAEYWEQQLGRTLGPGWFGENLRLDGIDVNNAKIGERWQVGDQVVVEVTMPRTPCQTFARWVGGDDERGWVKRFSQERRLGAYLSVVKTGSIRAGDAVTIVHVPETTDTVVSVYSDPE